MLKNYRLLTLTNSQGETYIDVIYDDETLVINKIDYSGPNLFIQPKESNTIDINKFQINDTDLTFLTNEYTMVYVDDYLGGTVLEPPYLLLMYLLSNMDIIWQ